MSSSVTALGQIFARRAFGQWNHRGYGWKPDDLDARSQTAALGSNG